MPAPCAYGLTMRNRSPARRPAMPAHVQCARSICHCPSNTALGVPVVPDVKRISHGASGSMDRVIAARSAGSTSSPALSRSANDCSPGFRSVASSSTSTTCSMLGRSRKRRPCAGPPISGSSSANGSTPHRSRTPTMTLRLGAPEHRRRFETSIPRADRHDHRTELPDPVRGRGPLPHVGHPHRDAIARADAEAAQPAGDPQRLGAQLGERQRRVAVDDCGKLARARRATSASMAGIVGHGSRCTGRMVRSFSTRRFRWPTSTCSFATA